MANKITFQVLADTKEFKEKFKDLNKSAKKFTRTASLAFIGLAGALGAVTKLAKDQQKVMNQTRAVIKSTGNVAGVTAEQIFELGKQLQKTTTFGDEAVITATNLLLTFKEISGRTLPRATKAILDMSVAMNQGLKESAIQLGKALNDPILGLTAMRRVGIQFTKSQEAQIKALVKMGKVAKAQGIILTELESQFGGSAEAARKGLGSLDALRNSLGDLAENIALSVAPAIEKTANAFTKMADAAKENKILTATIGTLLILGVVISGLAVVVGAVVAAFTSLGVAWSLSIVGAVAAVTAVVAAFSKLSDGAKETQKAISGENGLFPGAAEGAEGIKFDLKTITEKMQETKEEAFLLGAAIRGALIGGELGVISVKGPAGGGGEKPGPTILDGVSEAVTELKTKFQDLKALGKSIATTFHKSLSSAISGVILQTKTLKDAFLEFGKAMLKTIVDFAAEWIAFQVLQKAQATLAQAFAISLAGSLALAWAPAAAAASLATLGANVQPATAALTTTHALSRLLSLPRFAEGSGGLKDDTLGLFNKREMVIPSTFSDAVRRGDLTIGGGGGEGALSIVNDFSGATFNGVTDTFVEEIFTKASENMANNTLAFQGVA